MSDKVKRSRRPHAKAHRIHYLHVPMLSHCAHNPQAHSIRREEDAEHDGRERRNERPAQKNNFKSSADKEGGVQKHDPTEPWLVNPSSSTCHHLLLMAA